MKRWQPAREALRWKLSNGSHGNHVHIPAAEDGHDLLSAAVNLHTFIHPFDDETVATGQGSIAMEIIKELPTVDIILAPIGGGGLAAGVSTLAKLLNPNIRGIGVGPLRMDTTFFPRQSICFSAATVSSPEFSTTIL